MASPTPSAVSSRPSGPRDPSPRRRVTRLARREGRSAYVFLVPWFLGLAVFTIGPLVYSLYLSFTNYGLLSDPHWVGLANYRRMFTHDPRYLHSVRVTLTYVAISVPLRLAVAYGVATLLNRARRGVGTFRALFYLPSLLGGSVAVALIWRAMFSQDGPVNGVLGTVGITGQDWVNDPSFALGTIVVLACWQFGAPMVIFLAGLKQLPTELYDAAAVDGAGRWRQWVTITLPMLSPIIFFNVLLETVNAFQAFTPAFVVSEGTGGPADSTLFYTVYLYQEGFTSFRFGYASAMAWVLLATVAVVTALLFAASRTLVFYSDEGES